MNQITVCANPNRLKGEISFEEREKQLAILSKQEKRKERGSAYKEFAQLNMEGSLNEKVMNKLFDFPAAGKIFFFIANHMDGYNALIASYSVFAEALGLSNSTVTRGIKYLREKWFHLHKEIWNSKCLFAQSRNHVEILEQQHEILRISCKCYHHRK